MNGPSDTAATRGQLGGLLGYHLRRASAAMMADFTNELSGAQLRPVQFGILSLIADHDGISQTALCSALGVQKANMAPLIAGLERRGLVERKPAPSDRRVQLLTLTGAAVRDLPAWRALVTRHEERFLGPLSASEQGLLLGMLRKLWIADEDAAPDDKGKDRLLTAG